MHAYSETVLGLRIHVSMETGHNQRTESRYSISPHAYRLTGMHSGTHRYCTDLSTRTRTEDKKQCLFSYVPPESRTDCAQKTVVSARARPEPCADTECVVSERAHDKCTNVHTCAQRLKSTVHKQNRIRTEERTPVAAGANRLSHRVRLRAASPLGGSPRQTETVTVVAWSAARRQNAEVRVCFELLWLRSLAPLEHESPQP